MNKYILLALLFFPSLAFAGEHPERYYQEKWTEAIGQALFYGKALGRTPAVLLIIEKPTDWKYWGRLGYAAKDKGVEVWHISP